jgi:anti-anti-sigma regulatory factor
MLNRIMPLQLEQHQYGEVTVLRFISRYLGAEADAAYLLIIIDQLLGINKKHILLNLKELTEINEVGLDALTEAHSKVKAAEGVIKIVNAAQRQTDLLILSRLAPLFPSFNDEEEGVRSFALETGHFDILEFVREMNEEEQQQHLGTDGKQPAADEKQ